VTTLAAGWPAPPSVRVFSTVRTGGSSPAPWDSLNLGAHVGDDPARVAAHRRLVRQAQGWDREPLWLNQVHGTRIVRAEDQAPEAVPEADGAVTFEPGRPLVVMTADCLPVAVCDRSGTAGGVFHAGWKGLLNGVLEAGIAALDRPAGDLLAWIGPAIGPQSYQVGPEVRQAFLDSNPAHDADFRPDGAGRWLFDLPGAAARRLAGAGVGSVTRSPWDTLRDADLFFSHRRTSLAGGTACGRLGTFLVLEPRSLS